MSWPSFIRLLAGACGAFALAIYAFILVLDPYQNVPFAPPFARAPVSTNQRYAYPALARNPVYDSAIIGTSTSRLLDPRRLNALLGARFVNLAMNSATAYEQDRIDELFVRHHPRVAYRIIGIDETWCNRASVIGNYTFRDFPEWMFDDDPWNDLLYLFNDKALENAVRMLELLRGRREPKYRNDGYRDFTLDFGSRDAAALDARLYRGGPREYAPAEVLPASAHPDWQYPLLARLRAMVERTPGARVALVFPPLHARYVANIAENVGECKGRIAAAFAGADNVVMLDYLYASTLTQDDRNYWDPIHTTSAVARLLEADIAEALAGRTPPSAYARPLKAVADRRP